MSELDEISAARFAAAMQKAAEAMRIRVVTDGNENAPVFTTLAQFAIDNGFSEAETHALLNRLGTHKLVDGGGGASVAYRITIDSRPACGHSACSQNYIDTGESACVVPMLRKGDTVLWRRAWGTGPAEAATVKYIEANCVSAHGHDVDEVPWSEVTGSQSVVVDLENGHWAYGYQLDPMPSPAPPMVHGE